MELPVLAPKGPQPSWLREFARLEIDWSRGVAESTEIAGATVFKSDQFQSSSEANAIANAWLPIGTTWLQLRGEVESIGAHRAPRWWTNPSMPAERTDPVVAGLTADGWQVLKRPLLRWVGAPMAASNSADLAVVPSRAAYPAFEKLLADPVAVAHLDDPQVESWVALSAGRAVGVITVQISAQSAALRHWRVEPDFNDRGIAELLLARALDMCHRAEVAALLAVSSENAGLLKYGFEIAGEWVEYRNGDHAVNPPDRIGPRV